MRPPLFIALMIALPAMATAIDTLGDQPAAPAGKDTLFLETAAPDKADTVPAASTATFDTAAAARPLAGNQAPAVSAATVPPPKSVDSFSVVAGWHAGFGGALSLGSLPPLANWKSGLPTSLAGAGLPARMIDNNGDTIPLRFTVKENPDAYNMMFPLSLSLCRLIADRRFGAVVSFAALSKKQNATVEVDSLRSVTVGERMRYLAFLFAFDFGTRIPERFFSVDNIDRTDAVIGVAFSPLIALKKSFSVSSDAADGLLAAIADSISSYRNAFDAHGVSLSWRIGVTTLRRVSAAGGVEAGLSYQGFWCTRFRTSSGPLASGEISNNSAEPEAGVSWFSSRFDITISLIRKIF
ncbi:MAG: hypothetical protein JXA71_18970 [Chitinispirillaceae bacterium]|nr:hypothetical protein [Chitinispirillaceae bacterium]